MVWEEEGREEGKGKGRKRGIDELDDIMREWEGRGMGALYCIFEINIFA